MKRRSSLKVMLQLVGLVRPLAPVMVLAVVMGVCGFLAAISITVFGGFAMMDVLGEPMGLSLKGIFFCLLIFAVARGILRYAEQACNHYIAFKLLALIRDKVFGKLRSLAPAKLECKDRGNLISVITSDIELLEVFYAHTISPCCIAVIVSLLLTGFIGQYHIGLALIAFAAYGIVGILVPFALSKASKGQGDEFRSEFGRLNTYFMDSMRGLSQIIQFGAGSERLRRMNAHSEQMSETEEKMKAATGYNGAITGFLVMAFTLCMFFAAAILYQRGEISFGAVVISTMAMAASFGPVIAIANLGTGLSQTLAAGNRVLDILEEQSEIEEVTDGTDVAFDSARLEAVSFSYEEEAVLDQVSLEIVPGRITGLMGKSGSGKSTMLKLLMRFWDAESGRVSFANKDIKEVNTNSLRDNESYMTQETHLFHDTIENNIRIAKLDATKKEIVEACQKASVHDFIQSLPKGYETEVGELGSTLSGGERQRLGLARAFLHQAPLILLDEPTSNLDSLNESVILKALKEEADKTVVLVSHRLSTMRIADYVYQTEEDRKS